MRYEHARTHAPANSDEHVYSMTPPHMTAGQQWAALLKLIAGSRRINKSVVGMKMHTYVYKLVIHSLQLKTKVVFLPLK